MNIAILCPGPSLSRVYQRQEHDLVIAVNTAGWLYPCDYLAFQDLHIIEPFLLEEYQLPRIGCATNSDMPIPSGCTRHTFPSISSGYTLPRAMAFAATLRPSEVHAYGFDCSFAKLDAAGQEGQHTRNRWLNELPWMRQQTKDTPSIAWHFHGDASFALREWVAGRSQGNLPSLLPEA